MTKEMLDQGTTEMMDRYGHYGEERKVYTLNLILFAYESGEFEVATVMPDGREVVEYAGPDEDEATETFELIGLASVPECVK